MICRVRCLSTSAAAVGEFPESATAPPTALEPDSPRENAQAVMDINKR